MDIINFRKELKVLLAKYNAGICFSVSAFSDTHGLSNEELVCYEIRNSSMEYKLAEGWSVDENDL